jgi:hypothetical protein
MTVSKNGSIFSTMECLRAGKKAAQGGGLVVHLGFRGFSTRFACAAPSKKNDIGTSSDGSR